MRRPRKADPRAQASGFRKKIPRLFLEGREAWNERRDGSIPRNPNQLADWLTRFGDPVSPQAVRAWERGDSLPESRYVSGIETLFQCPWTYLDDASTKWPPSPEEAAIFRRALRLTARQRSRVAPSILAALSDEERPA